MFQDFLLYLLKFLRDFILHHHQSHLIISPLCIVCHCELMHNFFNLSKKSIWYFQKETWKPKKREWEKVNDKYRLAQNSGSSFLCYSQIKCVIAGGTPWMENIWHFCTGFCYQLGSQGNIYQLTNDSVQISQFHAMYLWENVWGRSYISASYL